MTVSTQPIIRKYLKGTDGATVKEVFDHVGGTINGVSRTLKEMPDTYIDRWTDPINGQYRAVYCVVEVPDDCPKPRKSNG